MDLKTMSSIAKKNEDTFKNKLYKIAMHGKTATPIVDGIMRWLDEGQIIRLENPQFRKANAEFDINGKSGQFIWFSQISSVGVCDNLQTPLLDEIVFKGQPACHIKGKYLSAQSFWNDVKDRKFKVEIIASGFSLNFHNDLVNSLITDAIAKRKARPGKADQIVFDYIRQAVNSGNADSVKGTLKIKNAYRLIEI